MIDPNEIRYRLALYNDFGLYAKDCLKIRTKTGIINPFLFNQAQRYMHGIIERQRQETGKVRIINLKGRQLGMSTYFQGRMFWRITHSKGLRGFILTHEKEATKNLFEMAQRFYEQAPLEVLTPLEASSEKEMLFKGLDSGYRVGTAGNKGTGRSSTVQLFHGSEAAFWPNASSHMAGIMQAIPNEPNTEVYLESTANGKANMFYQQWQLAEAGESGFIPVFIPWFWQPEYRATFKGSLTKEEKDLKRVYGLDDEQIAWRRLKIVQMDSEGQRGEDTFRQEYPCNAEEAFEMSSGMAFPKLNRKTHMLRPFKVPDHWTKFISVDWGRAKPFSVAWYCVCDQNMLLTAKDGFEERFIPAGALIMYREWYGWNGRPNEGCGLESFEVARKCLKIEEEYKEEMDYRIGDSAMWSSQDGPSIQEKMYTATDGQFNLIQSIKDRQNNYEEICSRLVGEDGYPMLYITENCKHAWRTLPALQLDELHPEKGWESNSQEDHIADQLGYACASRPYIMTEKERNQIEFDMMRERFTEKRFY